MPQMASFNCSQDKPTEARGPLPQTAAFAARGFNQGAASFLGGGTVSAQTAEFATEVLRLGGPTRPQQMAAYTQFAQMPPDPGGGNAVRGGNGSLFAFGDLAANAAIVPRDAGGTVGAKCTSGANGVNAAIYS